MVLGVIPSFAFARALIPAIAAVAFLAAVPAASAKSCGNLIAQGPIVGATDFEVHDMSCASAAKVVRRFLTAPYSHEKVVFGYKVAQVRFHVTGRKGQERFSCDVFGAD
jgi:hypothetical protein